MALTWPATEKAAVGPLAETPWEALVERARASDTAAFETVIGLTRDAGWRLACQHLHDEHQAQDVLQEAYIVVFTRIDTLRDARAFRSWFLRIVLNLCRNARRSQGRAPLLGREGDLPETAATTAGFEERVATDMELNQAMTGLTQLERSSILLRDYLQLSYQEMAEVLRIPLGTVKSRLNAARRNLLRRLKGDA